MFNKVVRLGTKFSLNMEDKEQITKLYINAYRSFLKGEGLMGIDQIEGLYKKMTPSIHKKANSSDLDIEGFMYASFRLPFQIKYVKEVVMAQTEDIFQRNGYKINFWKLVQAPARRRKMYFDQEHTLSVFINSVTDLDDMVGLLCAYSIEWNKIHSILKNVGKSILEMDLPSIAKTLNISNESFDRLLKIYNDNLQDRLFEISQKELRFELRLLRGNYVDYKKATQRWFENILEHTKYKDLRNRPVYFVSSNTHSLVNTLTGFVNEIEKDIINFIHEKKLFQYINYWEEIKNGKHEGSKENFLWYILKKFEAENPGIKTLREKREELLGIETINSNHYLDINVQLLSLKKLIDAPGISRIIDNANYVKDSDAVILNIDYPLGSGAYMVLANILQNINLVCGIYILGKASFLHANIGDIGVPTKVFDTYSENTFIFKNAFSSTDFLEFKTGSVLSNQAVVSTKGTFLHPESVIEKYFINGYSVIEMEDGPYLNAVYEASNFHRFPEKETIDLLNTPIDLGIIHYASDTPFTKAITLGTRNLGYEGVDATYVSSLAILRRIFKVEKSRV